MKKGNLKNPHCPQFAVTKVKKRRSGISRIQWVFAGYFRKALFY